MIPGDYDRRKRLISRNSQDRFLRDLSERGKFVAESKFTFIDDDRNEESLERVENRIRFAQEREIRERSQLLDAGRNWLCRRQDIVLCYIRNTGVLKGDSNAFVEHLNLFTSLLATNFLFSTETFSSGIQCLEDEGSFICIEW